MDIPAVRKCEWPVIIWASTTASRVHMLQEISIKNFALIEDVKISWSKGLNVLTGETGAGKSIIIDAVNAVLGGKTGPSAIRLGAEKCTIEAIFAQSPDVAAWLKQQELQSEDLADCVVVSREITKSGSRMRVNGTLVNANLVQELRQMLLTIHAQHEARTLMLPQAQLELLDGLGDKDHRKLLERVRTLYQQRKELSAQLTELQMSEDERLRKLDFARFQLAELQEAALEDPEEYETVAHQCKVLSNIALLESSALRAQELLNGGTEESPCAIDLVQDALRETEKAAVHDEELKPICDSLAGCVDTLETSIRSLRRYREFLDTDPESLANAESRLDVLATIKRKYGPSISEAISARNNLETEVGRLENSQAAAEEIQEELAKLDSELAKTAGDLSNRRKKMAASLAERIRSELADLGMEHCKFEIHFEEVSVGGNGLDRIEFLMSPNPGQPLLPVAKIASGGELSRVMLAIKSIFAEADRVATVVFDEIDTGISGKVLQSMRDKLARLGRSHQILCITHQPIIASAADNHILINKVQTAEETHIDAAVLDQSERVKSLAAMAAGQTDGDAAIKFAQSLLDEGNRLRSS
jgi:DNA repair protein RecN (Recombination protein N)